MSLDEWSTEELLQAYLRTLPPEPPLYLLEDCIPQQRAFIQSKARKKVAVTGGRAGKTWGDVAYLVFQAISTPGCFCAYATKTRQFAKDLAWRPLVYRIRMYDPGAVINASELTIELTNGSLIKLAGCDDEGEADKLRGFPWILVIIDEVQSIRPAVLKYLLNDVLRARLADYGGTLACTGTPDAACSGHLFDIDQGKYADQWDHHHWTLMDNEQFPQWAGDPNWKSLASAFIIQELQDQALEKDDPVVQREYFGRWVPSADAFILQIDDNINTYAPPITWDCQHVLGIDLGFNDESAFVVTGFSTARNGVWHVTDIAHPRMGMDDIMETAKGLIELYRPIKTVVDPSSGGANLVEGLRHRYGLAVSAAEKENKASFFRLWNADIRSGRYKFLPDSKLLVQCKKLQWDERCKREREGIQCDLADAALYSWRESYHYLPERPHVPKVSLLLPLADDCSDEELFCQPPRRPPIKSTRRRR